MHSLSFFIETQNRVSNQSKTLEPMKKKKKAAAGAGAGAAATADLKAQIREHSTFFDHLIELIPARFYLPPSADDWSSPWFQGLSKSAKAAAKKQSRDNLRIARRQRLDPENPHPSTLERLEQTIENKIDVEDDGEGVRVENNGTVTYEELRQRLHRRIEALRGNRGESSNSSLRKRKREPERRSGFEKKSKVKIEEEASETVEGVEFGKVKLGGEDEEKDRKRQKVSKGKELERARKLEEAKRDPEKGGEVARKHSWRAAVSRAAGEKVHDNPKLLRQSMHKEKKRQEKNTEKWKERVESREKAKAEKQQKRAGNIAERIQQNKARKIAKREKKLLRPGFEGRKEGYINQ